MKFSAKVFMCTIIIIAVSFSIGAYLLISGNFNSALEREIRRGLEEYQLLRFAYESGVLSRELQGDLLTEQMLKDVARQVASDVGSIQEMVRIYGDSLEGIYSTLDFQQRDLSLIQSLPQGSRKYIIEKIDDRVYMTVAGHIDLDIASVFLCSSRDISEVFGERDRQIDSFVFLGSLIMGISSIIMLIISILLTRPIKKLKATSIEIASGHFSRRVFIGSGDEIGELAASFNKMADSIEEKVIELEKVARQKEEFMASFSHEIKTPLTSIIGYADMLRSKELSGDITFKAASHIFKEGKRLEALSSKIMELLLLERQAFKMEKMSTKALMEEIEEIINPLLYERSIGLKVSVDKQFILVEPDLIKTLLINLIDNARKASNPGQAIEIMGQRLGQNKYLFSIKDYGKGIPEDKLDKITQAFYMVDKSRARIQQGAGLGLALSSRIAEIHGTNLSFQSQIGKGTKVTLEFKLADKARVDMDE